MAISALSLTKISELPVIMSSWSPSVPYLKNLIKGRVAPFAWIRVCGNPKDGSVSVFKTKPFHNLKIVRAVFRGFMWRTRIFSKIQRIYSAMDNEHIYIAGSRGLPASNKWVELYFDFCHWTWTKYWSIVCTSVVKNEWMRMSQLNIHPFKNPTEWQSVPNNRAINCGFFRSEAKADRNGENPFHAPMCEVVDYRLFYVFLTCLSYARRAFYVPPVTH
jgi:hypothetical protein